MSIPFADWFPLLMIGIVFTTVGLLKVYGFRRKIVGGGDKPYSCRLVGTCPTWTNETNFRVRAIFLSIGLLAFAILGWLLMRTTLH
jgi:hypothetical protein